MPYSVFNKQLPRTPLTASAGNTCHPPPAFNSPTPHPKLRDLGLISIYDLPAKLQAEIAEFNARRHNYFLHDEDVEVDECYPLQVPITEVPPHDCRDLYASCPPANGYCNPQPSPSRERSQYPAENYRRGIYKRRLRSQSKRGCHPYPLAQDHTQEDHATEQALRPPHKTPGRKRRIRVPGDNSVKLPNSKYYPRLDKEFAELDDATLFQRECAGLNSLCDGAGGQRIQWGTLVMAAILGSPRMEVLMKDICHAIKLRFPNFAFLEKNNNVVRHTLSINTAFEKVKIEGERACLWRIAKDDSHDDDDDEVDEVELACSEDGESEGDEDDSDEVIEYYNIPEDHHKNVEECQHIDNHRHPRDTIDVDNRMCLNHILHNTMPGSRHADQPPSRSAFTREETPSEGAVARERVLGAVGGQADPFDLCH
ncbi:hypothetical protein BU17DRAFT_70235 [Hysterangium stoloniferum]|nr:hypothetical protein BU17DRAFT_70235 [Hysterangium stoloniferum]